MRLYQDIIIIALIILGLGLWSGCKDSQYKYFPKTKEEIKNLVEDKSINLGEIDTSAITDMSYLFEKTTRVGVDFNGLESWDTSKVKTMRGMFYEADNFNHPIGSWDISNVEDMGSMFEESWFNQPLDSWDTSKVKNMKKMFSAARSFNQNINAWNVSNVENMSDMFGGAISFNQPLNQWNVANVKDMSAMFYDSTPLNIDSWEIDRAKVSTRDMFLMYQGYEESIPNPFVPKWYDETLINEQDITEAVSSCFKWGIGCEVNKISFKVPFDAKTSTITFFKGKEQGYFENLCLPHPEENNTKRTKKIYNELRQCLSHHKVAQETLITTHFKDIYIYCHAYR